MTSRILLTSLLCAAAATTAAGAATLVVANKAGATVSLVDPATGNVRATLPTGQAPHEVAVSPGGTTAVVANYGTRSEPGSTLTVVDIRRARVLRTVDLAPHRRPHGIAFLPDGKRLAVTSETSGALLVVNLESGRVERAVATGQEVSHMVALAPSGKRAFVTNIGSGTVSVLDLAAGRRLANVPTGKGAEGVAVTPDGREVWVTNRAADTVTVLDARSLQPLAELAAASFPIRAAATPDGRHVLVTCARSGDLAVFDRAGRRLARRIPLGAAPTTTEGRLFGDRFGASSVPIGVVVSGDGTRAFVAHSNADRITVVDLDSWTVTGSLTAGPEPDGMGWSPVPAGDGSTRAMH